MGSVEKAAGHPDIKPYSNLYLLVLLLPLIPDVSVNGTAAKLSNPDGTAATNVVSP